MASPVIEATNTYQSVGDSETHTIPLPSGVSEGDRLVILACVDNNTALFTVPSGYNWKHIVRSSTQVALIVLEKVATSSESNPDIVLNLSDSLSAISLRVSGSGDFMLGPALSANSSTQDPPLVDFANWTDTPDALSVACMFWDTGISRTVSAFPTGYDSNQTPSLGEASTGTGLALASKNLTGVSSEDAPAFTLSANAQGAALSIIFREPYAAGSATNIVGTDEGYVYDLASGSTDRVLEFRAMSEGSPVTGLSSGWTVTAATNNGTGVEYSSPTISEVASGYYKLTIDEQTTIGSGQDFEYQKITIEHASHDTVTLRTKLVRPKITAGETLTVSGGEISGVSGSADVVVDTTIATVTDQQTLVLTAGLADSGSLDGCLAIITDQSTANQKSIVFVQLHTVSTGTSTITLVEAPAFSVSAGDHIKIFAKQPDPIALLAAAQSSIDTYAPQTTIDWSAVIEDMLSAFLADEDFGTTGMVADAATAATALASVAQAGRAIYYVSSGGNDSNSGLSVSAAKATITAAKTAASSGSLIVVMPGTYNEGDLLKDGVDYHFVRGARVVYTGTGQIFSDNDTTMRCVITGDGYFHHNGTGAGRAVLQAAGDESLIRMEFEEMRSAGVGIVSSGVGAYVSAKGVRAITSDGTFDCIGESRMVVECEYAESAGYVVECDGTMIDVTAKHIVSTDSNPVEIANGNAIVRGALISAPADNQAVIVVVGSELSLIGCSMAENNVTLVANNGTLQLIGTSLNKSDVAGTGDTYFGDLGSDAGVAAINADATQTTARANAATAATQSTIAATEIGKVPRAATALTAGDPARRTKVAATSTTLDETVGATP